MFNEQPLVSVNSQPRLEQRLHVRQSDGGQQRPWRVVRSKPWLRDDVRYGFIIIGDDPYISSIQPVFHDAPVKQVTPRLSSLYYVEDT